MLLTVEAVEYAEECEADGDLSFSQENGKTSLHLFSMSKFMILYIADKNVLYLVFLL